MADENEEKRLEALGTEVHDAKVAAGLVPDPKAAQDGMGKGMQSGFELVGAILGGALLGLGLDRWLETKPFFMLLLLVLGFASGLWRAYRSSVTGPRT